MSKISFSSYYCAISGKNNSGKSNVLRVLRLFFRDYARHYFMFPFEEKPRVSIKEDLPAWNAKDSSAKIIRMEVDLQVNKMSDEGLYQFLIDYLDVKEAPETLDLNISTAYAESGEPIVSACINGTTVDARRAQEVLKKSNRRLPQSFTIRRILTARFCYRGGLDLSTNSATKSERNSRRRKTG